MLFLPFNSFNISLLMIPLRLQSLEIHSCVIEALQHVLSLLVYGIKSIQQLTKRLIFMGSCPIEMLKPGLNLYFFNLQLSPLLLFR